MADDLQRRANKTLEAWDAQFKEARHKVTEKDEDITGKLRASETGEVFHFWNRVVKAIRRR
jgi:hypothetical protein